MSTSKNFVHCPLGWDDLKTKAVMCIKQGNPNSCLTTPVVAYLPCDEHFTLLTDIVKQVLHTKLLFTLSHAKINSATGNYI